MRIIPKVDGSTNRFDRGFLHFGGPFDISWAAYTPPTSYPYYYQRYILGWWN